MLDALKDVGNNTCESCFKRHGACLWLLPGHFQQIKMSNTGVAIVLSKCSIFLALKYTNGIKFLSKAVDFHKVAGYPQNFNRR